ncbi:uncharacterized protein STEHIDRAFT_116793 [Stereum hirsutum FP-91666 SS1]|uniref:F-box domain-containing protein n=1 Tax=Stereum hirsutum (strain FP-91666) TaxID=721885 RepID=R7RWE7_STEHR|nr:uncharacterized protein STEHIDRAFT_116793 [Stereum hirsutum FP-91666 SS1]EIM79110.1 hypothetical protein STEHIDRAFT_116793 [Stereum hirsutum FP-91666 SS1]
MYLQDLPLEILIQVLSTLSLTDMQKLMLVNFGWRWLIQRFLSRKYHLSLLPYVDNPSAFRDVMRTSHSIISGSFALDFGLHGTTEPLINASDIDVYTGVSNAITIVEYLRNKEGYLIVPVGINPCWAWIDDYEGGITSVIRMLHPRGSKIDVVCSSRISALHPLSYFWGTLVMNFLTSDGYCSAYPSLTERGIGCIHPLRDVTPRVERCIEKYKSRGFSIRDFAQNEAEPHTSRSTKGLRKFGAQRMKVAVPWHCPHVVRSFSDAGSLHLAFSPRSRGETLYPFEEPEWIMGGSHCGGGCKLHSEGSVNPRATYF